MNFCFDPLPERHEKLCKRQLLSLYFLPIFLVDSLFKRNLMSAEIKCPNCGTQFEPNDAIREEVEKELRTKAADWQKKKNEEFQLKMEDEKKRIQQSLEESL